MSFVLTGPYYACEGDIDGDFDVDGVDLAIFAASYGLSEGDPDFDPRCDFNYDKKVDVEDLAIFSEDYGRDDCPMCFPIS